MKYNHQKQKGLTLISLIFLLGLIGFFTLLVLKISPIYMNHSKVVHALESVKNRPDILKESKYGVWHALVKQFSMNYVDHIERKDVTITSRPEHLKIQIQYHIKQPLIANLSVWVDFDNSVEVGKR